MIESGIVQANGSIFKVQHRFANFRGKSLRELHHASHLAKDLFRQCILKVVDDHHEGCPEKI